MKVLVVGSGGREHALAWKISQSQRIQSVYVAPGNGGTARDRNLINLPITNIVQLRQWAQTHQIALTLVGPEAPLALGIVDEFRQHGLRIFGPTKSAAQLESSKAFSKDFMSRHKIPTAQYQTFSDTDSAHAYVNQMGAPIVVKADGLAAGKGVVVAMTDQEAHEAIDFMLLDNALGVVHNGGGARVVIEEFLAGEEASFMVVCDGQNVVALATSQDHKRLLDHDMGPNTGGMGAYSPAPVVTPEVHAKAMRKIILPTIRGMKSDRITYTGFLYAGLMIDPNGQIKTLEFNCRMGDPETQPIMMRLKTDLVDLLWAATDPHQQLLKDFELQWNSRTALGVVMAAHGYPLQPRKGDTIHIKASDSDEVMVFYAGTIDTNGILQTQGGRVLCVTALGATVKAAQQAAYQAIDDISFDGQQYRTDIGYRAMRSKR
ncbi:MAG: phosphoribosylamine--glycine ligase [Limnohabitans sp.]|nr:phosphoribosylamine--glycine ligase [Limnohabitans sp.]